MLVPKVGLPVVDRTGLKGSYDIDVEYDPDLSPEPLLPSLGVAIQDRLGLSAATKSFRRYHRNRPH
jgi:uncharacterized protein (TIGR03435 family)